MFEDLGFVSRTGYKQLALFALKRIRPDDLWGLHELRPHVAYRGFWNFDGLWETGFLHVGNHWEWESGFEIHSGMKFLHESVDTPFDVVSGVTVPAGNYNDHEVALVLQTDQSAPLAFKDIPFCPRSTSTSPVCAGCQRILHSITASRSCNTTWSISQFTLVFGATLHQ
jgi:hypothetical protein